MIQASVNVAANYIGGEWKRGASGAGAEITNPATAEPLASLQFAERDDVAAAVAAASAAFPGWRRVPPQERIQYLFRFKQLLHEHGEEIARMTTMENGKTLVEARAELARGIENVEVACGIPSMMQGYNLEDVASGNTFVLKPSERVPLTALKLFELLHQTGLPKGVVNLVVGAKAAVDALLQHPDVRAISFVGSSPVAKYIYAEGAVHGKRVQCQGGAKNHVVVMPDADLEMTAKIVSDSAFGCAGQRCLAVATAITVGDASKTFPKALVDLASGIRVGNGLEAGVDMGPVITPASRARILDLIGKGIADGGKVLLDGRDVKADASTPGNFLKPTVISGIDAASELTTTEIFGPVLSLREVGELDEAIDIIARNPYGNASSIFTSNGAAARKFRYEAPTGNIGVNIGVAAPMAYFPFSGWKDSFLGVLHGQGRDAVEFYTDKKVVVERWPKEWSRKF
jgi:malonate-semialdehyde dehydrogenase (acetylating)/methylmalonate-semialdehyde dehydrogenase